MCIRDRIMERAGSPAVKVYYDVGNSSAGGFDVVKEIRWLGAQRICQMHLKDNPHYLGEDVYKRQVHEYVIQRRVEHTKTLL